jgi:hypothetical protein
VRNLYTYSRCANFCSHQHFCISDDSTSFPAVDYSEKRSLPISVPDYRYMDQEGERYVVSDEGSAN